MSDIQNYLKQNLNPAQCEAALRTDSSSLILAGAGSGKTRTLTYKIAYLIHGQGIKPSNIMAVTFTNKAANEMKQRIVQIYEQLQSQTKANKSDDIDDILAQNEYFGTGSIRLDRVGTFHSLCMKILKIEIHNLDMGYDKNFNIYDAGDSLKLIKEIIAENKLADKIQPKEAKARISELKNRGITYQGFLQTLDAQDEILGNVYEKYQKNLQKNNVLDFDDLLMLTQILFRLKPEILAKRQNKFKYILVDEAQDTNQIQFDLIRSLSGKVGNVTFIGDDFQSIYRWRGAVMDNFLRISDRWPDVQTFKLEINYRSLPHIVQAGNCVIAKNTKQYEKKVISNRKGDDKIRVFSFSDETDEAMNITNLIKKMKQDKNYGWGDFAILYRTNAQSQPFEQLMIQEAIPYKIWGGYKFFERKEIKDIVSYLKYIFNPKDTVSLKRIINTPNRKIGITSVTKLEQEANANNIPIYQIIENIDTAPVPLPASTKNAIKQFGTTIKFITSQAKSMTPADLIKTLVSNIKYKDYLIALDGKEKAEEKMDNIGGLINMAANKYSDTGLEILEQFIDEIALLTEMEEVQKEEADAVKLMSVHSSKGLEFPVVFIVGLEEGLFPLAKAKFDTQEMEEERRLMYVAITRARNVLFLSHASSRYQWGQMKYNSPSRFIGELPEELLKIYDLSGALSQVQKSDIGEGQVVKHKLFGIGTVVELRGEVAMVRFQNEKHGIRKIDTRFLDKVE